MALRRALAVCFTFAGLSTLQLAAEPPYPAVDIALEAARLKAQAEACAQSRCPRCDCAGLMRAHQALVEAETVFDALHAALLEADAAAFANYNNVVSNSHLTGVKLAQLEESLAWQEFFHKLGSYLLKLESILNTLSNIDSGKAAIEGEMGALDVLDKLDSLANALKNAADVTADLSGQVATGAIPATPGAKAGLNTAWDVKSEAVDMAKVAKAARDAYKEGGVGAVKDALKGSRNLRTAVARALKAYSEWKLKQEKALLVELTGNLAPEAAAIERAFQEWQRVNTKKNAAADALAAVRAAKDALAACLEKAKCGSKSSSRPTLGPYKSYGEALNDLEPRLNKVLAALKVDLLCRDDCGEPGRPPGPPPTPKVPVPVPAPRHVVENDCPPCAGLALELARTLDEMEFVRAELTRIRANVEKAQGLEADAKLLRDSIDRLTKLIIDFRQGKKGKNALIDAGNKLFDAINAPHTEITLENLEREKRERQIRLHLLEERIAALRVGEDELPALEQENTRLFDLSKLLEFQLAQCRKQCVPKEPPRTKCSVAIEEYEHWKAKAAKYPNQANRNSAEAARKKLCECLAEHPEAATEELKQLCPRPATSKPGRSGNTTIGLVVPLGAHRRETIHCRAVADPAAWQGAPGVRVIEIPAKLPLDDTGRADLARTTVTCGDGPAQTADGPLVCTVPADGKLDLAVSRPSADKALALKRIEFPGGTAGEPPRLPRLPAALVGGLLFELDGPFTARDPHLTIGGRPALLVAGTPGRWHCLPPVDAPPGRAEVVYEEDGARWRGTTVLVTLAVSADRTNLKRGQSTTFRARVSGLDALGDAAWTAPFAADSELAARLAARLPGVAASAPSGRVFLVVENRSRDVVSLEGERDGRIVVEIGRDAARAAPYELARTVRASKSGTFDLHAELWVLAAPPAMRPDPPR